MVGLKWDKNEKYNILTRTSHKNDIKFSTELVSKFTFHILNAKIRGNPTDFKCKTGFHELIIYARVSSTQTALKFSYTVRSSILL